MEWLMSSTRFLPFHLEEYDELYELSLHSWSSWIGDGIISDDSI